MGRMCMEIRTRKGEGREKVVQVGGVKSGLGLSTGGKAPLVLMSSG
jgi:hypothetical protein